MAKPKFLLALDLDFTHFNSGGDCDACDAWIKTKTAWQKLYRDIIARANNSGIDVVFTVVTHKDYFDAIAHEAAEGFQEFLSLHNDNMYINKDDKTACLINVDGEYLSYRLLGTNEFMINNIPIDAISHFHFACSEKSEPILKLAEHYKIKPEHCIILDDNREVLEDAKESGIKFISYESFSIFTHGDELQALLKNQAYVDDHFSSNSEALINIVKSIINELTASNANDSASSLVINPLTPLYEIGQENARKKLNEANEFHEESEHSLKLNTY